MLKTVGVRSPCTRKEQKLIEDHEYLITGITKKIHKRFYWVPWHELESYARSGLVLAAIKYDPKKQKNVKTFKAYVLRYGVYMAIDEMRADGVILRKGKKEKTKRTRKTNWTTDICLVDEFYGDNEADYYGQKCFERVDVKDFCKEIICRLDLQDKRLIKMFLFEHMTMKKIADIESVSESAISLRYKVLRKKMKKIAENMMKKNYNGIRA